MEKKLPKNWVETSIGELFTLRQGIQVSKPDQRLELKEGMIQFLRIVDFTKTNEPPRYVNDPGETYHMQEDDIALVRYGTVGFVCYGKSGVIANNLFRVIPNIDLNKKYVTYYLKSSGFQNSLVSKGATMQALSFKTVNPILFPLPPLAEQRRIVAKLDELFGHLDTLKTRLDNIPQILKNFRQVVLSQAVTGKLTEEWRKGRELEEWQKTTVGKFMIEVKNKMNPMESVATNYIGLEHLLKDGGVINKSTSENLKSSKTVFKKGDVLYGKLRPYLNKHDVVTFDGVCSTDILVYRNDFEDSSYFFNYYLGTESFVQKANSESKGINLPRVSSKTINQFRINVPPKEEQTEIVKRVEHLFASTDTIGVQYQSLKTNIDSLSQAILAKAFKGELVEQLDTDGDAKELLEEIKKLKVDLGSKPNVKGKRKTKI